MADSAVGSVTSCFNLRKPVTLVRISLPSSHMHTLKHRREREHSQPDIAGIRLMSVFNAAQLCPVPNINFFDRLGPKTCGARAIHGQPRAECSRSGKVGTG